LKNQPLESNLRSCVVERVKFEGPENPMDIPVPTEENPEPEYDVNLKA
jgi:hypothetical protein